MTTAVFLATVLPLVVVLVLTAVFVKTRVAIPVMVTTLLAYIVFMVGYTRVMGVPKSTLTETADPAAAQVLWYAPAGDSIYLLLTWEGLEEPRLYKMRATEQQQQQLAAAAVRAKVKGRPLMMKRPFQKGARPAGKPGQGQGEGEGEGDGEEGEGEGRPGRGGGSQGAEAEGLPDDTFYAPPPPPLPEKYAP